MEGIAWEFFKQRTKDTKRRVKTLLHRHPQLDRIVWRVHEILLRAKIPFRRLDRSVSQQQLDLLKLPTTGAAEFGASTSEIVRGDARNTGCDSVRLDELPDNLLAQALACDAVSAIHRKT